MMLSWKARTTATASRGEEGRVSWEGGDGISLRSMPRTERASDLACRSSPPSTAVEAEADAEAEALRPIIVVLGVVTLCFFFFAGGKGGWRRRTTREMLRFRSL